MASDFQSGKKKKKKKKECSLAVGADSVGRYYGQVLSITGPKCCFGVLLLLIKC